MGLDSPLWKKELIIWQVWHEGGNGGEVVSKGNAGICVIIAWVASIHQTWTQSYQIDTNLSSKPIAIVAVGRQKYAAWAVTETLVSSSINCRQLLFTLGPCLLIQTSDKKFLMFLTFWCKNGMQWPNSLILSSYIVHIDIGLVLVHFLQVCSIL